MAKWEYLKVAVSFSLGRGQCAIMRLTPMRESHAKLVASLGLKALEKDPVDSFPAHDTIASTPWESGAEKFYALIDVVTADGWEPFKVRDEPIHLQMHLRRQTA